MRSFTHSLTRPLTTTNLDPPPHSLTLISPTCSLSPLTATTLDGEEDECSALFGDDDEGVPFTDVLKDEQACPLRPLERGHEPNLTLKDNDLNYKLRFEPVCGVTAICVCLLEARWVCEWSGYVCTMSG